MKSNKILIIILILHFSMVGCKSNLTNVKKQNSQKEYNKKPKKISTAEQEFIINLGLMLKLFDKILQNTNQEIDLKKIYGSWICSLSIIEDGHEMKNLNYTFNIDGTFNGSVEFDGIIHKNNGSFELNGNKLKIISKGAEVKVVEIEFTNDKLIFRKNVGSITFSRILN